jgi:GNAT superfamily N-acetyltransferase
VVFDEFTSVVDRTVAKIGSAAVSKAVRRMPGQRFVAVSCHYDICEWLEPDWVLDMATRQLTRRLLRRPEIKLELHQAGKDCWELFKRAHYLSASVPAGCRMYVAQWQGVPVACVVTGVAFTHTKPGYAGQRRIVRLVVLPDYQGVGIGRATLNAVAELLVREKMHVSVISAHPSMLAILRHDPRWKIYRFTTVGNARVSTKAAKRNKNYSVGEFKSSFGRGLVSAEFVGDR